MRTTEHIAMAEGRPSLETKHHSFTEAHRTMNGLIEQTGQGKGAVYAIEDGKVHRQPVQVGEDDGPEGEILSGLTSESQVVVSYAGSIAVGLAVRTEPVKGEEIATNSKFP